MKLTLKHFIFIIPLVLIFLFTLTAINKTVVSSSRDKSLKLDSINIYDSDSVNMKFSNKVTSIIIYFNTDCDHCQYEATEIQKNMSQFGNAQLLLLSIEPLANIRKFIKTYRLEGFSNLQVGQISGKTAVETFGFKSVPHILIYNAENQLVKEYKGETKIEAILKYL
jgi:thiol-disulfide isomerase/thioredoxin